MTIKGSLSRREFLGTGIAAGVVAAGMVPLSAAADDEDDDRRIEAREHSVPATSAKDGSPLRLALFEKFDREREPEQQAMTGRIALVLHGATTSGRVNNDVQVPGVALKNSFSLMDQFALRGYDVFTLDYQNYGRSDHHDCGLCVNTVAATRDIEAAVNFILQLRGVSKLHLIGWSWGGATGGLFTQQHADLVNRLVLYAPVLDLQKDFSKATSSPPPSKAFSIRRRASRRWSTPTSGRPSRWTRNRPTASSSTGVRTRSKWIRRRSSHRPLSSAAATMTARH